MLPFFVQPPHASFSLSTSSFFRRTRLLNLPPADCPPFREDAGWHSRVCSFSYQPRPDDALCPAPPPPPFFRASFHQRRLAFRILSAKRWRFQGALPFSFRSVRYNALAGTFPFYFFRNADSSFTKQGTTDEPPFSFPLTLFPRVFSRYDLPFFPC